MLARSTGLVSAGIIFPCDFARAPCVLDRPVAGLLDEGDVGVPPGRVVNSFGAGGGRVHLAENVCQIISRGGRGIACNLREELSEVVGILVRDRLAAEDLLPMVGSNCDGAISVFMLVVGGDDAY